MLLKRHYVSVDGYTPVYNTPRADGSLPVPSMPAGECLNPRPISHIEVQHTGVKSRQNFSESLVEDGLKAGIFSFDTNGDLLMKAQPETLRYKVLRVPGSYCLHCGENLNDNTVNQANAGWPSREHVALKHAGVSSPDPANPAGYERIHRYECDLDSAQQQKFSAAAWDAKRKGLA